jgi:hypothetical protein
VLSDGRLSRLSELVWVQEREYQLIEMFCEEGVRAVDFIERDLDFDIFLRQRNILIHLTLDSIT